MPSEPNPYSPSRDLQSETPSPKTQIAILTVVRVIVFSLLWAIAFYFGSAIVIAFATGFFFYMQAWLTSSTYDGEWIAIAWVFLPIVFGVTGLAFGLAGKLPGTRRRTIKPDRAVDPTVPG